MQAFSKPKSWDFKNVSNGAYDYDGRYCSGRYCSLYGSADEPCRDATYEGLRVDETELDAVHSVFLAVQGSVPFLDLPASGLVDHVSKFVDLEDSENFDVEAENGYYGEEAFVTLSPQAQEQFALALDSWDGWSDAS